MDGVEGQRVPEGAVRQPAAVGQQDVKMRMPGQELAGGLDEADRAGNDLLAVEPGRKVELEGPPGAAGKLIQELAGKTEVDVGGGPFPTELEDSTGEFLRKRGNEYGTVTRRPRRCGWLDVLDQQPAICICRAG